MRNTAFWMICTALAALALGCGGEEQLDPELERLGRAQAPPSATGGGMPHGVMMPRGGGGKGKLHGGEVVETIQVPKYTYLKLKGADGALAWAAIPSTEIEVGARVKVRESILMHDFRSRTLNRTFERIVFGTLEGGTAAGDAGAGRLPPGHPPIETPPATRRSSDGGATPD
jgi:hypothetical protein